MVVASIVAVSLLGVLTLFQLCLALGAPWGAASWGGGHSGRLPVRLRAASGVAAVLVYPLIGVYVLVSAGTIDVDGVPGTGEAVMWALTGFFVLGALANFASRSKPERIWGPVSLVIAGCCAWIALGI